ncbi:MAG: hypothetical protein OEY01_08105 [Desulfobulbaceae bacterium]|nr:hypothetical protein [Desulfobulbaceae bacterium]
MRPQLFLYVFSIALILFGACVSVSFWIPQIINKKRLREILGSKYPLVYFLYLANGPMTLMFGLLLLYKFH